MRAIFIVAAVTLSACATTYYDWGSYEHSIARLYEEGGEPDLGEEITVLAEEISETLGEGKRVPPGKHAHLGYLHYLAGNHSEAARGFEAEKQAFPESAALIDALLVRLQ